MVDTPPNVGYTLEDFQHSRIEWSDLESSIELQEFSNQRVFIWKKSHIFLCTQFVLVWLHSLSKPRIGEEESYREELEVTF